MLNEQHREIVRKGAIRRCHGSTDELEPRRNGERWHGDEPAVTYQIVQLRKKMLRNPHS